MRIVLLVAMMIVSTSAALPVSAEELSAADLDTRRVELRKLIDGHWEFTLSQYPEFASILGDKRYNDKVTDSSRKAIEARHNAAKKFLARFRSIDTTAFSDQERLNKELMVDDLEQDIAVHRFRTWEMPVNQMGGIHLDAPQLVSLLSFESVKDFDDYIARLRELPTGFADTMSHMRDGMKRGFMPPKFLLEKVAEQAQQLASEKPEASPFAQPLEKMPATFSDADKSRIRSDLLEVIRSAVLPAYSKFAGFVKDEYALKGRTAVGLANVPDGRELYAFRVRRSTTTRLSPEEIHQIGVREVARIETEMLTIAKRLGHDDLQSFNRAIEANTELKAKSRQHLLDLYRKHIDDMWAELPKLFGRLPKAKLEVMKVEEFREQGASGAAYNPGTPDGSRPGHVMVNTGDFANRKIISVESTAYHEGVPGHHMQIAIAQELPDLPPFRQQMNHTAYVEGWALYSERLGKETGFYQDPYSDYGRLQDEMLRAIRLVVDTGLHDKNWTRDEVVKYFRDHSALDEVEIQSETDRYIVWPGQALGYKIGQLKISELRERARRELGSKFDVRGFHDVILGAGSLPLDVLESQVEAWIARVKAK